MLRDCLLPFAHTCVAEGLVKRFFHMNYWLEGAHVRLRLELCNPADRERVVCAAHQAIQPWIDSHPSSAPSCPCAIPKVIGASLNTSTPCPGSPTISIRMVCPVYSQVTAIRERYYEREYDRYGGQIGMSLSQDVFQTSTLFVEKLLHDAQRIRLSNRGLTPILPARPAVPAQSRRLSAPL
ncbi:lantibiotic dehydratase C-terminal domain-containing protein, partial [Corynebacterium diphtheriae]